MSALSYLSLLMDLQGNNLQTPLRTNMQDIDTLALANDLKKVSAKFRMNHRYCRIFPAYHAKVSHRLDEIVNKVMGFDINLQTNISDYTPAAQAALILIFACACANCLEFSAPNFADEINRILIKHDVYKLTKHLIFMHDYFAIARNYAQDDFSNKASISLSVFDNYDQCVNKALALLEQKAIKVFTTMAH